MQTQRNTALILLLMLSAYIFFTWSNDKRTIDQQSQLNSAVVSADNQSAINSNVVNVISVNTDLFEMEIDLNGGDIVKADLKDQKQTLDSDEPFHLFQKKDDFVYYASSDLLIDNIDNRVRLRPTFTAEHNKYELKADEKNLSVILQSFDETRGLKIEKVFNFSRGSHAVDVKFNVTVLGNPAKISLISSLTQSITDPKQNSGMFGTAAYRGAAYNTADTKYTKESFEDIASGTIQNVVSTKGGWISMIQHYFASAWIGNKEKANTIQMTGIDGNTTAVISIVLSKSIELTSNQTASVGNILWLGPKNQAEMNSIDENLGLTVDYGWLSFISVGLFHLLDIFHDCLAYIGIANWGLAIIILTIAVRCVLYPLTKRQYISMAKLRLLTPKINEIKERYKDDRQKLGMEMMNLYKKENANPLGGCLPLLLQMPIFIALYWTLMESTELRHQPFLLWINDLSVYDPYFVLPILMGVSMFFIQKLSPTPITDPMQKKIMMIMPIVFTAMFCTFPAGLTLYWVVSNMFSIVQQIMIFRALEKKGLSMKNHANK